MSESLPSPPVALLLVCLSLVLAWRRLWLLAMLPAGFLWTAFLAQQVLEQRIPAAWVGQDIPVEARIIAIPESTRLGQRLLVICERWRPPQSVPDPDWLACNQRLRLNSYASGSRFRAGERWAFTVRLKPPVGFANPAGFDYEAWLFQQHIAGTGYIRSSPAPARVAASSGLSLLSLRQALVERLGRALGDHPAQGEILALSVGLRDRLTAMDWQRFQHTGTSHLIAISGLHVGMVSGFAWFLTQWGWRRSHRLSSRWPAPRAAACLAILSAMLYAALAGFAIPAQRALIMVTAIGATVVLGREISPTRSLGWALLAVLIWNPLSVLNPGFWLSFAAVGLIFYVYARGDESRDGGWLRPVWQLSWRLALGLFPLTLLFFQQASWVAPLANLVAVPWISFVVLPLALAGSVLISVMPDTTWPIRLAADAFSLLDQLLAWLTLVKPLALRAAAPSAGGMILAVIGCLWLLAPRGIPARPLGLLLMLPVLFPTVDAPAEGTAQISLLDVGQGLSAVVQTHRHTLVFDTGPRYPSGFNTGDAVLVPFLTAAGITVIDTLIISHGDNDHIGGARALTAAIPTHHVLTSVPDRIDWRRSQHCQAGQRWVWDKVQFEMLHPDTRGWQGNNGSCVLLVTAGHQRLLVPGDIETGAEDYLVRQYGENLRSTYLVAPHHGSKTSSSERFLEAIQPDWVLFPAGRFNRYRFPAQSVVRRYQAHDVRFMTTGEAGAIRFRLGAGRDRRGPRGYRRETVRIWQNFSPEVSTQP